VCTVFPLRDTEGLTVIVIGVAFGGELIVRRISFANHPWFADLGESEK